MSVTITNKKVVDFYKKYPDINLENLLCNFIDLIETFAGNYSNVSEERIIESVSTIKTSMGDINSSNLENFKSILKLNSYENKSDINQVLSTITNKNTELFSKTKEETVQILSELISKNKELNTKDNEIILEKFKNMLSIVFPQDLTENIKDYFQKNKTLVGKGQQSESKVETILNQVFPDAEIINMSKENHQGDLHLKRNNKDTIMIENKNYNSCNVDSKSVTKFIEDCTNLDMHGIILSHHSGIYGKRDWSIEIINNKVLVYLTNLEYDTCKILSAVSLIDNLSYQINKFVQVNTSDIVNIDQETMLLINQDISEFIKQKENLYDAISKSEKMLKNVADKIKLPNLTTFFAGKCEAIITFSCQYCEKQWPTSASRGSHQKGCDSNPNKILTEKKPRNSKNSKKNNIGLTIDENTCIMIDTNDTNDSDE